MEEKCCCEKKTVRDEDEKRAIRSRLNRIIGQLNGISKMVDEDKYCGDLLIQLSAASSALKGLTCHILDRHLHTCVVREVQAGNTEVIGEVVDLIKRFG